MEISDLITKDKLAEIIKDLVKNKLYKNEQQLQFDLAWEIKKELSNNNMHDWDIELEYLSATKQKFDNEKQKSIYTDLIILNKSTGSYIPIELKYKTKIAYDHGVPVLKNQGARDLGRFDFLWDFQRIHILKNKSMGYQVSPKLEKMQSGFAIILTNDNDYWVTTLQTLKNRNKNPPLYESFCIGEGQTIRANTELKWKDGKSCVSGTWRESVCPLKFDNDQVCNWKDCSNDETGINFKCLILEV